MNFAEKEFSPEFWAHYPHRNWTLPCFGASGAPARPEPAAVGGRSSGEIRLGGSGGLQVDKFGALFDLEAPVHGLPDPAGIAVAAHRLGHQGPAPGLRPRFIEGNRAEFTEGVIRHGVAVILAFQSRRGQGSLCSAIH